MCVTQFGLHFCKNWVIIPNFARNYGFAILLLLQCPINFKVKNWPRSKQKMTHICKRNEGRNIYILFLIWGCKETLPLLFFLSFISRTNSNRRKRSWNVLESDSAIATKLFSGAISYFRGCRSFRSFDGVSSTQNRGKNRFGIW